ncbi:molybdopterin-synthase adenylyltransferase MoeB [Sphingorhabdus sp. IMCC26285]|uniref:Molybdopterin-synthase adenylyltransferase n=1 Tax=Sphingorhabdus profundilacus TaxID=2509718 RepID=A0A6I4LWB8_9SPHN|nr:molybdopterin-synthase adenylyltransferase MoeB [Sphingorhabdus profundilacus]MVZ96366.1 molybdopterin-synthase adenylyltransferase MoeB [Sphingorhabdus profundilacus]
MAELSDHQLDRYARHIVLRDIGGAGQSRIVDSHVLLIGAGGIGSPAIQYLAAAGVGTISVVDDDAISLSNLQRQVLYSETQIGEAKVEAAAAAVKRLNPDVIFHAIQRRIDRATTSDFLDGVDVVIDGSDNFATRLTVNDLCLSAHVPLVSAAIGQFHGQIGTFTGWQEDAPCYRCFVGDAHDPGDCDDCATQGVLGAMCGLMGSFAAMEAIRVLTGFGDSQIGKLHIFDGMTPSMRSIKLPKDPACSSCGSLSS